MSLQITKHKDRCRCEAFLKYVRSLPCEDCRVLGLKQTQRTTASHLVSVKWSTGSDVLAVAQCMNHHLQSTKSTKEQLEKHGVDVPALHVRTWNGFIEEQGDTLKVFTQSEFEGYLREKGFVEKSFTRRKNR